MNRSTAVRLMNSYIKKDGMNILAGASGYFFTGSVLVESLTEVGDLDIVVFFSNENEHDKRDWIRKAYSWGLVATEEYPGGPFTALRHTTTDSNFLVTDNFEWYTRMRAATLLLEELQLEDKEERIALFDIVVNSYYE